MAQDYRSRRCYTVRIGEYDLLELLGNWRRHQAVAPPVMTEGADLVTGNRVIIPADYEVDAVTRDFYSRSFVVRISHPDFPEVGHGREFPVLVLKLVAVTMTPTGSRA